MSSLCLVLGGLPPPSTNMLALEGLDPPPSTNMLALEGFDPPPSNTDVLISAPPPQERSVPARAQLDI